MKPFTLLLVFLGLILGLQGVVITYDGWYGAIYFVEEDQNPSRNLPRAMLGTALCCTAIYVLVNAALLHVLGMGHLAGSVLPAADAATPFNIAVTTVWSP